VPRWTTFALLSWLVLRGKLDLYNYKNEETGQGSPWKIPLKIKHFLFIRKLYT